MDQTLLLTDEVDLFNTRNLDKLQSKQTEEHSAY